MILLCSLALSFENLVTTLRYGKVTIKFNKITTTLLLIIRVSPQNVVEDFIGDSCMLRGVKIVEGSQ